MRPQWFKLPTDLINGVEADLDLPQIPYSSMWQSDYLWLPVLLQDRHFIARTDYNREGDTDVLRKWWLGTRNA